MTSSTRNAYINIISEHDFQRTRMKPHTNELALFIEHCSVNHEK